MSVPPSRSVRGRPILAVAGLAFALLCLASTAAAYRPATTAQRQAIRGVVLRQWKADATIPCPVGGSNRFRLLGVFISTTNPRFANAGSNDSGCTFTLGYILRRRSPHGGRWHIVYKILDSAQPCRPLRARVPESVVREFGLEGTPWNSGIIGPC